LSPLRGNASRARKADTNRARGKRRGSLSRVVLLAVLASVLVAEIAFLAPALLLWRHQEIVALEERALGLLRANVDATGFPSLAETVRVGERLMRFSEVRGGIIYNGVGDEVASFGTRPALGIGQALREGTTRRLSADSAFLDAYFGQDRSGFAHAIVLRMDATGVPATVFGRMADKAVVVLLVSLLSGIAVALVITFTVVRPVVRLRDAAISATDNPDKAETHRLKWTRDDELGEAARAFDMLLVAVSVTHQEDLAANQEATERSSFAILTYDGNGRLSTANGAAIRLFGVRDLDALASLDTTFVRMRGAGGVIDVSPVELAARGDVFDSITVVTPLGLKRCIVNATAIRKRTGGILRTIVSLVDVTSQATNTERLESEKSALKGEIIERTKRLGEMRALFESCLVIMDALRDANEQAEEADDEEAEAPLWRADKIVNGWFAEASRNGLVRGRLEHNILPYARGEQSDLEAVFRQALILIYTRAESAQPALAVEAIEMQEGVSRFEVFEQRGDSNARDAGKAAAGIALARLGLAHALKRTGGEMLDLAPNDLRNVVAFSLPTVAWEEGSAAAAMQAASVTRAAPEPDARVKSLRG
jgi:PAS domain-containing protein